MPARIGRRMRSGTRAEAEAGTLEPVEELERFVLMNRVVQEPAAEAPR